jgi:hypothetical protein
MHALILHYFDHCYLEEENSMIHSFTVAFGAKYLTGMVTSVPPYETFILIKNNILPNSSLMTGFVTRFLVSVIKCFVFQLDLQLKAAFAVVPTDNMPEMFAGRLSAMLQTFEQQLSEFPEKQVLYLSTNDRYQYTSSRTS